MAYERLIQNARTRATTECSPPPGQALRASGAQFGFNINPHLLSATF